MTEDGGITSRSHYEPSWNACLSKDENVFLTSPAVRVNWNGSFAPGGLNCESSEQT